MNRKELVDKLGLVSRALATSNIIPIFQCFSFSKKTVTAYNDSLAIIAPCVTDEAFCVNGATLLGLLSNSHSEDVEFEKVDQDLVIKAGRSTFRLPWFPVEDFLFKEPPNRYGAKISINEDLLNGFSACLLTASKDQSQAALMGVCLKGKQLYSTDGDAISRYTGEWKDRVETSMLPNSFCDSLIKLVADTEAVNGTFEVNGEWAKAYLSSEYTVYGRLITVDNPIDYEAWIKKTIKGTPQYQAVPKGFDQALSRARIIADPESAKTTLTIQNGKMKLHTQTSMGEVKDTLAVGQNDVVAHVSAELVQRCASLTDEISVLENCCVFRLGSKLLILTSNMGE